jgi:hypothetical protein
MTIYTLATETYDGSEINVDLYVAESDAYEALAWLILGEPNQESRLNCLLDRLRRDGTVISRETIEAFRLELDATRWIGVVQRQYPPWPFDTTSEFPIAVN